MTSTAISATEDRALELLGSGFEPVAVASALNISEGRLSQIIADPEFSHRLSEAKYKNLAKHNETDNTYDSIEKKLAKKLDDSVAMMYRPTEIARTLALVNGLKRRGASNPDALVRSKPTVTLNIPIAIVNKFQMNGAGQVVSVDTGAGAQDLVTIQSSGVRQLLIDHAKTNAEYIPESTPKLTEADGVKWTKPKGRVATDLMSELGFSEELSSASPS